MAEKNYRDRVLEFLSTSHGIDPAVVETFIRRVESGGPLIKEDNQGDHICSFFVPIDRKGKRIYIGHHIKAGKWIPPGGHVKVNEMPLETVYREFEEELGLKLTSEKVALFDLGHRILEPNPRHNCKVHYDFWFFVETDSDDLVYLKSEFHDAGWFTFEETLGKIDIPQYNEIVKKLTSVL